MLAPLNSVQIHAFLHQLPQWTQLPQETNSFSNRFEHVINLAFRRESSNAKPYAAVCAFIAVPQRSQDVARLKRR